VPGGLFNKGCRSRAAGGPALFALSRLLAKMKNRQAPVHPGEILLEEFLKPLGISQNRLGRDLNIPARRVNEIVRGTR